MKQINGALRVCILFFILLVVLQCVKVTTEEEFQVSELKFVFSPESLVSKQNKKLDLIRLDLELKDPSGQAQTNRWTPGLTNILEFRTTSAGLHKLTIETVNRTFESNRTEFGIRVVSGEPYRIRVRLGRTVTLQMDDLVAQKTSDILPDKATNIIKTGLVSNTNLMIVKIDKILTNETKLVTDAQTNLVIQQTVTDQTAVLIETNLVETNDVIGTNTNFISPTNMVAFVTTNMDAVFSDTNELIDMQTSNVNTVSNINLSNDIAMIPETNLNIVPETNLTVFPTNQFIPFQRNFVIMSETEPVSIKWNLDTTIEIWQDHDGGMEIWDVGGDSGDGDRVWKLTGTGSWMGMGIRVEPLKMVRDLSEYANGYLSFRVKFDLKSTNSGFQVSIKSRGQNTVWWQFYRVSDITSYPTPNGWWQCYFPVHKLITAGDLDMKKVDYLFMFMADENTGYAPGDIYYIDDIMFTLQIN